MSDWVDVSCASEGAQKTIAMWNKDRAEAHHHGGHVKATASDEHPTVTVDVRLPGVSATLAVAAGAELPKPPPVPYDPLAAGRQRENLALAASFPGDKDIPLPPVPHDKTACITSGSRSPGSVRWG